VDISGETAFRFYMADNATMAATLEGRGILQTDEEFYFVSGEVEEVSADFETTLDVPASIGVGLAYQVNDKFLVAIDGEYIFWSQFEGFKFSFDNYAGLPKDDFARAHDLMKTDLSVPINWDDAGRVMVGMSYQLKDFVQLRGGFNFSQTVVNDDTFIPQFMDLTNQFSVSLGLGFNIQNWRLEWAGVYTNQGDVTIGSTGDVDGDGMMDNIAGDFSGDIYRTLLGLSYRF
jgi:long-chain fatty acid transport protein